MNDITTLKPQEVWKNFYSLTQIPRPSKGEAKVIAFMRSFGEGLGLDTVVDEAGNIIIRKPATKGMENRAGVIMQAHLDMVPQKNSDKQHDFATDPITAIVDGEWVHADGTTLGADDGMGAAAAMAVLASKDIPHGPLECLFTIDEETGMTGANALKSGLLKGDILLNMDSETEGELYIGCAGGVDVNVSMDYAEVDAPNGFVAYDIALTGLKGGHSGMDINIGRANSNKLLFRFLNHCIYHFDFRLVTVDGGSLRNAIPRESFAKVLIPQAQTAAFEAAVAKFNDIYAAEFVKTEPNLSFKATKAAAAPAKCIDDATAKKIIKASFACPHGIERMSDSMPGLVETSNNFAIAKCQNGHFTVNCLTRSSVDSAKEGTMYKIGNIFDLIGAKVTFDGSYPGWKPNVNSPILKTMQKIYRQLFNTDAKIMAVHAGLECGILGAKYPHWDMISFGPTILHPHSPDEKVNIQSVDKFWKFIVATLKEIPIK